ncbi:MAG: ABC transporter permease [Halolamina sp.]
MVVVARRELRSLASEKTIVLALAIQLFVAAFSSFLVVGLVSLYDPGGVSGYTVQTAVSGSTTDELLAAVDDTDGVTGRAYDSREAAMDALADGRVSAVLHARETDDGRVAVAATVPDGDVRTTVTVAQLREVLGTFERAERLDRIRRLERTPLAPPPRTGGSPYFGFTYTVLVPVLLLLPAFIGGSVAVDSVTEEIDRGTLELLRVTPATLAEVVGGKLLVAVGLAPVQAALWLTLLSLNGTPVSRPLSLLALATAFALAAGSLGAAVALWTPDRRAAQFLYSVGVLGLFGGLTLLPGNPANVVARFAVGNPDLGTVGALVGYVVVAVAGAVVVARLVDDVDPEALA